MAHMLLNIPNINGPVNAIFNCSWRNLVIACPSLEMLSAPPLQEKTYIHTNGINQHSKTIPTTSLANT